MCISTKLQKAELLATEYHLTDDFSRLGLDDAQSGLTHSINEPVGGSHKVTSEEFVAWVENSTGETI